MRWSEPKVVGSTPTIKNHTATFVDSQLYVFGGYDGRRNHCTVHIFDCETSTWTVCNRISGKPPAGRNGHTATLAARKIFIVGGWLGAGPLAASDMHILHIDNLRWEEPAVVGKPPGPCNMHTADYIPSRRQVFVFRGGDGREYLNDLHGLDIDTYVWAEVIATGSAPVQRANHSSSVVDNCLYIFGGWDGHQRLNDIHVLDLETLTWTAPVIRGPLPHPRAGMTFVRLRDRVYLFGGSGPSAKCFNDLQVFDAGLLSWVETVCVVGDSGVAEECAGSRGTGESQQDASSLSLSHAQSANAPAFTRAAGLQGSGWNEGSDQSGQMDTEMDGPPQANMQEMAMMADNSNPNDEQARERVILLGQGPGRRAGHTATVVHRRIYVFGGSYGSEYLNDFYVLDTDPPPEAKITAPSCFQLLRMGLRDYTNSEDFSDIVFMVEGKAIYGHKIVLSLLSERFKAMFSDGFRESSQKEIIIYDYSYKVFSLMIEYLYTGQAPTVYVEQDASKLGMVIELMKLADQYMLDHLKQICETKLQDVVRDDTVDYLLQVADQTNAWQLSSICRHFIRNRQHDF